MCVWNKKLHSRIVLVTSSIQEGVEKKNQNKTKYKNNRKQSLFVHQLSKAMHRLRIPGWQTLQTLETNSFHIHAHYKRPLFPSNGSGWQQIRGSRCTTKQILQNTKMGQLLIYNLNYIYNIMECIPSQNWFMKQLDLSILALWLSYRSN